ncbi:winged helix-turn-helix domain-containing protein [Kitasatospora herbaricolor]|uniref:Winged helix-turn-helix domain-containing protein n=1 Tax=Kitasatospora herbaricolor TaxID=68217 RepID=A0ABZ1WJY9_9ACTN|nr:winged helix-turn-helix domain-containing protein [Kitasatospora herbaricolor]
MRYAQAGGYTPQEQAARERVRLEAAERFGRGETTAGIARALRVSDRLVGRWRRAWESGGVQALLFRGPVSVERLSAGQWARLEAELQRGPLAHGFEDDQRWTLKRVKLLIGRMFHVGYTVQGVWKLLRRHGWSCQVPVRRALERDEAAVEVWKEQVWPQVKEWRRTWVPTSASRTRQDRP